VRRWFLIACLLACKSKEAPPPPAPPPPPADAAVPAPPPSDWTVQCAQILAGVPRVPATRRAMQVIDGCRPCGDWTPLLKWADQAISRAAVDAAMTGCKAFCSGAAKQKWNDSLDDARGTKQRTPWRHLGEICKAEVSAVPDSRFMSAPYFALDRIARAAAADPKLAPLLAAIELPLPPVTITGSGLELPESPATMPDAGVWAITVTVSEVRIGKLPRAKLGADGVTVIQGDDPYPGALVPPAKLAAAIDKLDGAAVAVIAPTKMPAKRLLDVIAARGKHDLRLAVAASGAPQSWTLAGLVPVTMVAARKGDKTTLALDEDADAAVKAAKEKGAAIGTVTITLGPNATVAGLAKLLGALAYFDVASAALTPAKEQRKVPQ
jgi:hypothetical protein